MALSGKVCIVTGATRGIGKGIALQLGKNGAKVYITGRTLDPPRESKVGGSPRETAQEIEAYGGTCIPVQCDHKNDKDIENLFEQVKRENDGRLDILVNNAYSAVNMLFETQNIDFWDQPMTLWDEVNHVGLRNHYICSIYAARLMVPRKRGLIINISSMGGLRYFVFNAPYGAGKEACDRMAADCAVELKRHNVAFVSLWPGAVPTETIMHLLSAQVQPGDGKQSDRVPKHDNANLVELYQNSETIEFAGKCIVSLAVDSDIMKKSGRILMTCDLAREYGLTDVPGHSPTELRQVNKILAQFGYRKTAMLVPSFVKIPHWILALSGNKF